MDHIEILEIRSGEDVARYWAEQDEMHRRDVFPHGDLCEPADEEEQRYFLSGEYREAIEALCARETDPVRRVFFTADGNEVGFAVYVIYTGEDGKCFVLNFCIYPQYRCRGVGAACFAALEAKTECEGAEYFELNVAYSRSARFWQRQGFLPNGLDEYGVPLLCRPPKNTLPVEIGILDPDDEEECRQLRRLQQSYRQAVGEDAPDDDGMQRLQQAMRAGKIVFFGAKRGCRVVGMCSAAEAFSTFECRETAVLEDFFIEPVFRGQGIARRLARAAQKWCAEQGCSGLAVTCAACDEEMYRALGFGLALGKTLTWISDE